MISALVEGYAVGLSLIILIGPVLFVLINTTLESGVKSGIAIALGIFISDVIAVALCYTGSAHFTPSGLSMKTLSFGGALITLFLGARYLTSPPLHPRSKDSSKKEPLRGLTKPFLKGFAVNFINPFVFLVWLGIISIAQERYPRSSEHLIYLAATLLGILSLDLCKATFAERLRPLLEGQQLRLIMRCSGVILVLFGLRLAIGIL